MLRRSFCSMATWSTLTPSDLWGVVLEITSKYANKKLNLSNSHWGRAKVGGFSPILLMWNITHFNWGGHKYQRSEMSKWNSCERFLKKPGPMLARDQALSRRSRPYRCKDRVSKSDISTLTSYRDSPPIRKSKQKLGVLHPASRSFLNWTRRKGLYRNRVKSLLSMRKPLLGDVSKPGQLSLSLLDAILIFVLKARFWPSPCQKYDPRTALTGLTEVTSPETWATATYSATRLTVATKQSSLQIIRQWGCANFIVSHASLQSSCGCKLITVAQIVELTYLHVDLTD